MKQQAVEDEMRGLFVLLILFIQRLLLILRLMCTPENKGNERRRQGQRADKDKR